MYLPEIKTITLDFSGVTFIDEKGLQTLSRSCRTDA
jgi:anti-anti-sigma regulatory factor